MKKRIRLTAAEIEAILAVAGNADAEATFADTSEEGEAQRELAAFESGMEKLREKLSQIEHLERRPPLPSPPAQGEER